MQQQKAAIPLPLLLVQKEWSERLCIGHGHGRRAQGPAEGLNQLNDIDS
jgi:hypothetical protein